MPDKLYPASTLNIKFPNGFPSLSELPANLEQTTNKWSWTIFLLAMWMTQIPYTNGLSFSCYLCSHICCCSNMQVCFCLRALLSPWMYSFWIFYWCINSDHIRIERAFSTVFSPQNILPVFLVVYLAKYCVSINHYY